jgi:acetyltransferase
MTEDVIDRHYLTPLLAPASVAIVGATERKGATGEVLIKNMLAARFEGELNAVNPKYRRVHGVRCFPALSRLPKRAELAVIATPPATVPGLLEDCGRAGIRAVIVITAGFGETGPAGKALEDEVLATARRYGIRVLGPNCLGVMRTDIGFNATFAMGGALPGSLALVSQSGALCTAMLDWARPHRVGFSSVVSLGGSSDIDFGEVIDFLANDHRTEHILMYIEGVRDARRFMSSLRAAARLKPVIVMKVGRNPVGSRAAMSYTGAIVGADDVFDAAIRRAGVVRVKTVGQLVAAAQALAAHVRPRGNRMVVITNGGGPGVMAADVAADMRIPLATLSPGTLDALQSVLPSNWSHGNPVDLIGDATAERYRAAVAACLADDQVDGALVILSPQAMTEPSAVADAVIAASQGQSKPVLTCWMGEEQVADGRRRLIESGHLAFRTPESAVEMFAHVSSYYRNQRELLQTPGPRALQAPPDLEAARTVVEGALSEGRSVLSEDESKRLLKFFGLPVVPTEIAPDEAAAVPWAERLGWPVALKVHSPDITHKTDAGGVMLNLPDAEAVR